MKRWIPWTLAALALAQFIRPSRVAVPLDPTTDLVTTTHPSAQVADLLHTACYDCHSGQPRYPWYASITPVNWWLNDHIQEGRREFDMGTWGARSAKWKDHKVTDALRELKKGDMPLGSYTWLHADARLDQAQRDTLITYFQGLTP